MKFRLNLKTHVAIATLPIALGCVGAANAQTLPKEGRYDAIACHSGVSNTIAFSKSHTASSVELVGTIHTEPPGGMFDRNSYRCVGMNTSFEGKTTGSTVCELIDPDGDKRLSLYSTASDGKLTKQNISGTGKYEGYTSSDTVMTLGPFPAVKPGTFQACSRQTGTYKLK
jgi:hypothetical protein